MCLRRINLVHTFKYFSRICAWGHQAVSSLHTYIHTHTHIHTYIYTSTYTHIHKPTATSRHSKHQRRTQGQETWTACCKKEPFFYPTVARNSAYKCGEFISAQYADMAWLTQKIEEQAPLWTRYIEEVGMKQIDLHDGWYMLADKTA